MCTKFLGHVSKACFAIRFVWKTDRLLAINKFKKIKCEKFECPM